MPISLATSGRSRPAGVAGATIAVRNVLGSPRRSSSARSQSPFAMLRNWVVEAMVDSVVALPRQEEAEEVRDQQQRVRALERLGPRPAQGIELVERVDRQELATGAAEDLGARDDLEHLLHRAPRQLVAIVSGIADQLAVAIEQSEVAPPGVDGETLDLPQPGVRRLRRSPA